MYLALHTLFARTPETDAGPLHLELPGRVVAETSLLIGIAAPLMVFRLRWSVLRTLGACALLGLLAEVVPA